MTTPETLDDGPTLTLMHPVGPTLDDLLAVRALGVTRVGATATKAILDEARRSGNKDEGKS